MISILLSCLLSLTAFASVDDGQLVNPQESGHPFLSITNAESTVPNHSPEWIAKREQERADGVCNYLGSPSGLFFTRHAAEFSPDELPVRGTFAVVTFDDANQSWYASLLPQQNGFSFATIHCVGD